MICGSATGARMTVTLVALLLFGCQSAPPFPETAQGQISSALEQGIASQPQEKGPPKEVSDALLPPIDVDTRGGAAVDLSQRFDISVSNAPAREFFMSLVEGTPFNVVVHPGVEGSISLNLKNVTIPDVMNIARNVYGYEFERTKFGFEVLPARLRSRVYQVDFLHMRRSGSSETRVSSGQITQTDQGTDEDGGTTTSSSSVAVSGTRINTEQPETTFWTELEASIRSILGSAPGRSVVVNPQSGVVVVRAMPHELREVESFLETTQAIARRQVILEAKILEVALNDEHRSGINWAALFNINGKSITLGQTGGGSIFDNTAGTSIIGGNTGNLDPNALVPIVGTAASAFGGMFTAALAFSDFNAFIELLERQGAVHTLSSPRIATMNNQKAVIKVGTDEFFVTDVSSTTVTGTATTTTPSVELTPFFSGIALDVTPQISANNEVILHVHPAISVVEDQQKTVTIAGVTQTLPLALSTVRESDSIVRARSGQVVVIGGLMENRLTDDEAKTPGLGDLPAVGSLFRHKNYSAQKTELVILLRPMVAAGGRPWTQLMSESAERINSIHQFMESRDASRRLDMPGAAGAENP